MTSKTDVTAYILVDGESRVVGGAPNEDAARKQAEDAALRGGAPVYVFQKLGSMVPSMTAKWEGPGR